MATAGRRRGRLPVRRREDVPRRHDSASVPQRHNAA
jgi:hypothetical protein